MGFGTTQEVFAICQLKVVLISLGRGLVSQLCGILERHLNEGRKNQGSQIVA